MSTRMRVLGGLALTSLFVAPAFADITGSAHDFSGEVWNTTTEVCVVCHAPHGNVNTSGELLWNRAATATSFIPYDSPTLDGASAGPGATSLVCLSCHDGTIAVDNYGGATGGLATITTFGLTAFSDDLGQDHPVGVDYDPATDTELNTIGTALGTTTVGAVLQAGAVECASCHDVHNTLSAANPTLLNAPIANSEICLACHNK